jgi:hypothetical protein
MYARVTTLQIQSDRLDAAIHHFEETVAPGFKDLHGFVSAQLLIDRTARKAIVVMLWETLADLGASDANRQQQLANPSVAALLDGVPVVEVYEVAVRVA